MKKLQNRRVRFEALETRALLAGGGWISPPAPPVFMKVAEQQMAVQEVLPSTDFVLGKELLTALPGKNGRINKGQFVGATLLPSDGSAELSNLSWVEVWADLTAGKVKTGWRKGDAYETCLGSARANEDGVLEIPFFRKPWVGKAGLKIEYVARANSWLEGDAVGVEMEVGWFKDVKGAFVPEDNVAYQGSGTLHTLLNKRFELWQQNLEVGGNVFPGQKGVDLIGFDAWWSEGVAPKTVTFETGLGSLGTITNLVMLADFDYDGVWDASSKTLSVSNGGKICFTLPDAGENTGGRFAVQADISTYYGTGSTAQLLLSGDASATDLDSGKLLKGVKLNGQGLGQIFIQAMPEFSPLYTVVANPKVSVWEKTNNERYVHVNPGDSIVLDQWKVSGSEDFSVNYAAINIKGTVGFCTQYVLAWDLDGDGLNDGSVYGEVDAQAMKVVFEGFSLSVLKNQMASFKVFSNVSNEATVGSSVQAGLAEFRVRDAQGNPFVTDQVFRSFARQTWYFTGGMG